MFSLLSFLGRVAGRVWNTSHFALIMLALAMLSATFKISLKLDVSTILASSVSQLENSSGMSQQVRLSMVPVASLSYFSIREKSKITALMVKVECGVKLRIFVRKFSTGTHQSRPRFLKARRHRGCCRRPRNSTATSPRRQPSWTRTRQPGTIYVIPVCFGSLCGWPNKWKTCQGFCLQPLDPSFSGFSRLELARLTQAGGHLSLLTYHFEAFQEKAHA